MKLEDIVNLTHEFMEDPIMFNEAQLNLVQTGIGIMLSDIDLLMVEKEIVTSDNKHETVLNTLLLIGNVVLESPLPEKLVSFILALSELIYNWNANTYQDEVFRQLAMFISRAIDTRNVLKRSIEVGKSLDEHMIDLSGWAPPAYEVSKVYFEQLLEENEM